MQIILASGSPRRKDLLEQAGIEFQVVVSKVEEIIRFQEPDSVVMDLSSQKAMDVADNTQGDCIVIGADTIVAYENEIMGKPVDEEDAFSILWKLQGHTHQVYTGVSIILKKENEKENKKIEKISFYEKTDVVMYPMTEKEIWDYIATKEPMDKAGAYGIQGKCAIYIKEIHGDYNNVVGLPLSRIYMEAKKAGINLCRQ
jgi:septum formation protein